MSETAAANNEVDNGSSAARESALTRKFREQSDANLHDYLKSLASETPIKVSVIRELPKTWEGKTIEGTLDSFEDPISEEEIRELFGGGKYKLVIYTPGAKGSWQYATARKLKIAGDPRLDGLINSSSNQGAAEQQTDVVRDAMRMSQQMIARAQDRADRADEMRNEHRGPDPSSQMMMDELRELRRSLAAKDERIFNMATNKPDSSASDMLLGKMVDGESARMQSLRQQVESEMRMKNDMHKAEIDRLHARYEDGAKRQEDSHKREIDNMIRANDNQMTIMKSSFDGQLAGFQREIAHLDRQLIASQKEVSDLRAKKDRSAMDSLTELAQMKDAMESFTGSGDKDEGGALERIVGNVMGSPLAEGIAARMAGGPAAMGAEMPQQQHQEAEAEIPVGRPVQLPDGRIIVRKPDGTILQLRKKESAPVPTGEAGAEVSDEEIGIAMQFMQSALSADADPVEFGRTARNLAPSLTSGPIQELLRTQGVDAFLVRVSKMNPNSALLSQHGKNWARKVAAVLLES